jgi:phage-related protein
MDIVFITEDVKAFISTLPPESRRKASKLISLLCEAGHLIRMPHSKPLGHGIFELRIRGDQEVRMLYIYQDAKAVVLHCFLKKTDEVPQREIDIALERKRLLD